MLVFVTLVEKLMKYLYQRPKTVFSTSASSSTEELLEILPLALLVQQDCEIYSNTGHNQSSSGVGNSDDNFSLHQIRVR
jgi:hypothetical protein